MKLGNIKGALLEYIVRNLLKKCGFTNVHADNVYSFERGGLFYIHGKGAAHDADVIMNPPIQMPFAYPTQLLFECKAYGSVSGLPFVRNAMGLRNDLNDFEIVTLNTLHRRKNNRRASYAIHTRMRFLYQVGVASVNDFSKPAVECAANNKIPLISLSWFLDTTTINNINGLTQKIIDSFRVEDMENLYSFFKDREGELYFNRYSLVNNFLQGDNVFADIVRFADNVNRYSYVGVLETGDIVFLFARSRSIDNVLNRQTSLGSIASLKAEIHWKEDRPNVWVLTVYDSRDREFETDFDFYVPNRIFSYWKQLNLAKESALNIKQQFFSRIFVFNQQNNPEAPFSIVNIDEEWLSRARQKLERVS